MAEHTVLDLFCGEGGAALGYAQAGFRVIGVDMNHPTNPHATENFIKKLRPKDGHLIFKGDWKAGLELFWRHVDLIHASPPCQLYSGARGGRGDDSQHPDLIHEVRNALKGRDVPFVIENVKGARKQLDHPEMLCGCMFELTVKYATPRDPSNPLAKEVKFKTGKGKPIERDCGCQVYGICNPKHLTEHTYGLRRERFFESGGWILSTPSKHNQEHHKLPNIPVTSGNPSSFYYANGSFPISVDAKKTVMGCDWMTPKGIAEAIPPAFTHYIGERFLEWQAGSRDIPRESVLEAA